MLSFVIIPLLLGTVYWGFFFWRAQAAGQVPITLPGNAISGRFATCGELVARVKDTIVGIAPNVTGTVGSPLDLDDITVEVVELLPTVGAVVDISISVQVLDEISALFPLPDDGAVVTELRARLDNVVVTTGTCP